MIRGKLMATLMVGALASVVLAGCGGKGDEPPSFTSGLGTPSASASPSASATSPAPVTTTKSSPAAPTYPSTAKAYSGALMSAYGRKDRTRAEQLATSDALLQLDGQGTMDGHWSYVRCDGAAGTEYCLYRNYNGDEAQVGVVGQYLGQPHAVSNVIIEKTVYPTDAVGYAGAFVLAYAAGNTQRMAALGSSTVVTQAKLVDKISAYTPSTDGAAGSTYVHISGLGADLGKSYYIRILNERIGSPHAITCVNQDPSKC